MSAVLLQGHLPTLSAASFSVSDEERENDGSAFSSNSSQSDRFSPVHSSLLAVQPAVEENLYVHLSQEVQLSFALWILKCKV
jgi:hypothetical protein